MLNLFNNQKGMAVAVVAIISVLLVSVAGMILSLAFHQKTVTDVVSGKRTVAWYRAQAGVVDARWRLRDTSGDRFLNLTANNLSIQELGFLADYYLDLDDDSVYLAPGANAADVARAEARIRVSVMDQDGANWENFLFQIQSTGMEG